MRVSDGFAFGGMDFATLGEFQKKFGVRFDFKTRTFVLEDPVIADRIGVPADKGQLNPEENEKVLSAYWQFTRNYYNK